MVNSDWRPVWNPEPTLELRGGLARKQDEGKSATLVRQKIGMTKKEIFPLSLQS